MHKVLKAKTPPFATPKHNQFKQFYHMHKKKHWPGISDVGYITDNYYGVIY